MNGARPRHQTSSALPTGNCIVHAAQDLGANLSSGLVGTSWLLGTDPPTDRLKTRSRGRTKKNNFHPPACLTQSFWVEPMLVSTAILNATRNDPQRNSGTFFVSTSARQAVPPPQGRQASNSTLAKQAGISTSARQAVPLRPCKQFHFGEFHRHQNPLV